MAWKWDIFFNTIQPLSGYIPYMIENGNHEVRVVVFHFLTSSHTSNLIVRYFCLLSAQYDHQAGGTCTACEARCMWLIGACQSFN